MNYTLTIDNFEGPLDLLLHLIKTNKMDIYDISITKITEEYLDFINKMEEMNLTVASSYLVMASELIEIKSKMLLPNNNEEEEEDPREDLVNRLVEYQRYKDMIASFKGLEESRKEFFTKDPINFYSLSDHHIENDGSVSVDDLALALSKFLERKELEKPIETKITMREISVEERSREVRNILRTKRRVRFVDLFEVATREYVVVTFLTILEMCRKNELKITQDDMFGDIMCEVNDGE